VTGLRDLAAQFAERVDAERAVLQTVLPAALAAQEPGEPPWAFQGSEVNLARFALLGDVSEARTLTAGVLDAVREPAASLLAEPAVELEEAGLGVSLLGVSLVGASVGLEPVAADADAFLSGLVSVDLDDETRRSAAIVALAHGLPEHADDVRGGVWLPEPLAVFHEVAAERLRGRAASDDDVRRAWQALAERAADVVEADSVAWLGLVAAGRIVRVIIDGLDEGGVAAWARSELTA